MAIKEFAKVGGKKLNSNGNNNGAAGSASSSINQAPRKAEKAQKEHEAPQKAECAIAEIIFRAFLDKDLAGPKHRLTTGQVLEHLGTKVSAAQKGLFKDVLQRVCSLAQPTRKGEPGVWSLRPNYAPKEGGQR